MVTADVAGSGRVHRYAESMFLEDITWAGPQLHISWRIDRLSFATTIWYSTVDFDDLESRYGKATIDAVAFHIALFEVNKGVSFGPATFRIATRWLPFFTTELWELWQVVVKRVWAQWRYEHDRPDYGGPEPTARPRPATPMGLALPSGPTPNLWFCGGGKDSLLAGHLLDSIGEAYDGLTYAHSAYGRMAPQIELIDRVLDASNAAARHRMYIYDSATDLALAALSPYADVRYVAAAETPASIFAALPIVLAQGHRALVLAHERSANAGNAIWNDAGEEVNHQWGKSLEAERLLGGYIRSHLLPDLQYFSVLQPVHDTLIFGALGELSPSIPGAHSCNVEKPWCRRCAKCAYVWICYKAWLPWDVVDPIFDHANLLDRDDNQIWYRQMLGLADHTPFECIGQVDEVRLAFALARARGLEGRAMSLLAEIPRFDASATLDRFLRVDHDNHLIPEALAPRVLAFFDKSARRARSYAQPLLDLAGPATAGTDVASG